MVNTVYQNYVVIRMIKTKNGIRHYWPPEDQKAISDIIIISK